MFLPASVVSGSFIAAVTVPIPLTLKVTGTFVARVMASMMAGGAPAVLSLAKFIGAPWNAIGRGGPRQQ